MMKTFYEVSNKSAEIPEVFISHASEVLGETETGLSGSQIVKKLSPYAIEYNIPIPFSSYPFPKNLPNKRTALKKNLEVFLPKQQFKIIKNLCELEQFDENKNVKDLKIKLITRYGHLNAENHAEIINEAVIDETKHWLSDYPESFKLFEEALSKFENKIFQRNLLDDLRLSLEKLLQELLDNKKSLENQLSNIGTFIKNRNCSKVLSNMFIKLIDYYAKYQNTYIKHDDSVLENEVEIIFEITCSFMKFLIRIK